MKIGIMSVCAADQEIDSLVRLAADMKVEGLELAAGYLGKFRGEPEGAEWHINTNDVLASAEHAALKAKAAGIAIYSFASRCGPTELEKFESLCRAAQSIGCPQVRIGVASYDAKLGFWGSQDRSRDQLREAVEIAREYGVRAVVELHDHTMADGVLASRRLVEGMDPKDVGIIFDAGNARIHGWQPWPETLDILWDYISHVHIKDMAWSRGAEGKWNASPVGPGEGLVEWPELLRLMGARGYKGWLSIEDYRGGWCQKNPEYPTKRKVSEWKAYLEAILAGL